MECLIGLGKIHCQNCYFWRDGKCSYDEIIQEMKHRKTMERMLNEGEEEVKNELGQTNKTKNNGRIRSWHSSP